MRFIIVAGQEEVPSLEQLGLLLLPAEKKASSKVAKSLAESCRCKITEEQRKLGEGIK